MKNIARSVQALIVLFAVSTILYLKELYAVESVIASAHRHQEFLTSVPLAQTEQAMVIAVDANYMFLALMVIAAIGLWYLTSTFLLRCNAIIETSPDGVAIVDRRGVIEKANRAVGALLQLSSIKLQGTSITDYLCKESQKQLRALLDAQQGTRCKELYICRNNGEKIPVEVSVSDISDGGRVLHGIFIRNIQSRLMLETQLRQAQKLESIGQLAAGIAHEINTPVQYVGDNTRFFQDEFSKISELLIACKAMVQAHEGQPPSDRFIAEVGEITKKLDVEYVCDEIPQALKQTLLGIDRVTKIVRAMKEFSHPGGTEKVLVDINKLIESTVVVSTNEWKYVATIDLQLDASLPPILCFPSEISQVILNLIVNSAHAIEEVVKESIGSKGVITITSRNVGGSIEVKVTDTGAGIPRDIQNKIYDPFFTTKPVGKGTGQGLSIVRNIVTSKHGGTMDFISEVGHGTTFTFLLPLRPSKQPYGALDGNDRLPVLEGTSV